MAEVPTEAFPPALPTAIILIVIGLLVAYQGKTLYKVTAFLLGALAGGLLGYFVASFLAPGDITCLLAAVAIGAIVGGAMALRIAIAIIALAVAGTFAWIAGTFVPDLMVMLVAFLIGFIAALILMNRLLGVITGVVGGALAGFGVYLVISGAGGGIAGLVVGVLVALTGIYYQNHHHHGDLSRPRDD